MRNRAAQADLITDELNYRQSEIQDKQLHNNIKLNVINAYTAMRQARAAYETSVVARKLQDETLAGMRRKYELGTSTITDVVVAQRDSTTRQLAEVDARRQYIDARTSLRQQLGTILEDYNVNIDEAKIGQVGREADIPVVLDRQPKPNRVGGFRYPDSWPEFILFNPIATRLPPVPCRTSSRSLTTRSRPKCRRAIWRKARTIWCG